MRKNENTTRSARLIPLLRLVEMIPEEAWRKRGKSYATKLERDLLETGLETDARLLRNLIDLRDGKPVPMAVMDGSVPGWRPAKVHPPVNQEVIVLTDESGTAPIYRIALGHIVNTERCQDHDGWNIPAVGWWMPCPAIPE